MNLRYKYYCQSEIDIIEETPKHWKVIRLKDLGQLQNGISKPASYFGAGFPFVSYGNVYNNTIRLQLIDGLANSSKEDQKLYSVKSGDVFFTRTSETVDEIGISATCLDTIPKATFSGFTIRLRPSNKLINKLFSSFYFNAHFNRLLLSKQISLVTRASLSQGTLYNLKVLIPTIEEQALIANYLSLKTKAIDKKIKFLEQKTLYYKELRKSLINETTCQGINKDVEFHDSGINSIGLIPKHWQVKRLKDSFKLYTGNSISDKTLYEVKGNTFPYIATKDIDINTNAIDYENGIYIPKSTKAFKVADKNSTLLCLEGGSAGKKIGFTNTKVCFVNKLCCIKSIDKLVLDKYLFYLFKTPVFEQQFFALLNGLIGGVSLSLIKFFNIIIPTISEQEEIVSYLDEKTRKIDLILKNIISQIDTLKELRKTLINDVVTGKVKVSEVVEENVMN